MSADGPNEAGAPPQTAREAREAAPEPGATGRSRGPAPRALAGWALALVLLGYAGFVHHGLGPYPDGALEPWSPRETFLRQSWITPFEESPALGVAAFALPAALGAVGVWLLTASAIARTLALAAVIASGLFAFYGLRPPGPGIWRFFGWRGSAVMVGLAFALAATLSAPLLARSWLRLGTAARVATYVPVALAVVVILRNVTGTDPSLRFAISPWPVVPLFGMKIGSVAILGVMAAMACGAWSFAGRSDEPGAPSAARRGIGLLVALALPAVWFRLWHDSLPPTRVTLAMTAVAALFVAAAAFPGRDEARRRRGRHLAWGFLLAAAPLAVGEAWATWDYTRTREGTARVVIDAIDRYYQERDEYPEELSELVKAGHLERVPRPQVGFAFIEDQEFVYQSFGTSYNLEFSSPDWVQCAYNPAWSEEDDWDDESWTEEDASDEPDADGDGDAADEPDGETALAEAWSCPSSPPELW